MRTVHSIALYVVKNFKMVNNRYRELRLLPLLSYLRGFSLWARGSILPAVSALYKTWASSSYLL
jgi:hypothetical protein